MRLPAPLAALTEFFARPTDGGSIWRQRRCVHCLRPFHPAAEEDISGHPAALLCPECRIPLAASPHNRCRHCAVPLHGGTAHVLCGACLQNPPSWSLAACHGLYGGALRDVLLRLKYDGHMYLAPLLGGFLLEACSCLPRPDAVVAVPRHARRLRQRGYDQAHEIAAAFCAHSGLHLARGFLTRPVPVQTQAGLSALQRQRNVGGSFAAAPKVRGLRLWIVDDTMTTGSTMEAAARALLAAGAARVDALFVARTPRSAADCAT
ncbi:MULTISPECIES: ComF family protein [unclassified Desulfovibrio]|uniref:ComF family protein n=1 Tax=unclassified Desulfovibrio TaxID=2593640 RepID=UPI000F5E6463|nr:MULTISPECIES: ComF family protein [unclassified Desulfovibrio]RRD69726.1 ComF family protein [Desulfovibrio sp. OH1209_COT-279]RRD86359.1 ComF family protein [Desulfovibrio sp. OH1186_COT-070]